MSHLGLEVLCYARHPTDYPLYMLVFRAVHAVDRDFGAVSVVIVVQFSEGSARCMSGIAARKVVDVDTKDDWIEVMQLRSVSSW